MEKGGMRKGITPVVSIIILLLIAIALAGSAWMYISAFTESQMSLVKPPPIGCDPDAVEVCNGFDDNCNGQVDEGSVCGECVPGPEVCDGIDNDCNNQTDEGFDDDDCEEKCGFVWTGNGGSLNCCGDDAGEAGPYEAEEVTIDGNDNDCDGQTDEVGAGKTYYVDATNGNDSMDGLTEANAWKTISRVNSGSFLPGDSILLKRGDVWREQLVVPSSGTAASPITFGAYGIGASPVIKQTDAYQDSDWFLYFDNGTAKIWETNYSLPDGLVPRALNENGMRRTFMYISGTTSTPEEKLGDLTSGPWKGKFYYRKDSGPPTNTEVGSRNFGILIHDKENIVIDGIDAEGPAASVRSAWQGPPIYVKGNSTNIIIKNLKVSKSTQFGIATNYTVSNVEYDNITATESQSTGIDIQSQGGAIKNSRSYGNGILEYDGGDRGGISVRHQGGNILITGNEVYNNGQDDEQEDFEISIFNISNPVTITKNYIHDCSAGCIQIAIAGSNSEISYNIIDGFGTTTYPLIPTTGKFSAIRLGSHQLGVNDIQNVKIYNNIIANGGEAALLKGGSGISIVADGMDGMVAKNNIFFNNTCRDIDVSSNTNTSTIIINNNLYFRNSTEGLWRWEGVTYYVLEDWQIATGNDVVSLITNPVFVSQNDFHLQSGSPAIDKGTDVGLTQDYEGNPVPQGGGPDIGAYEQA